MKLVPGNSFTRSQQNRELIHLLWEYDNEKQFVAETFLQQKLTKMVTDLIMHGLLRDFNFFPEKWHHETGWRLLIIPVESTKDSPPIKNPIEKD